MKHIKTTRVSMNALVSFACLLAENTEKIILSGFRRNLKVERKNDDSPVTIADRDAEQKMRELIGVKYPDHGILGEEFGETGADAEYVWVLDPIDGTQSFICGVPLFGTLIALLKNGKPIIGVIHLPVFKEMFVGVEGSPTTCNGKIVRVRESVSALKDAVLTSTDFLNIGKYQKEAAFLSLAKSVRLYRGWGDCYAYTLLVQGKVDIVVDPIMNAWDIQALIPVVRGAGGVITDYQGKTPENGTSIVASTPSLHVSVIRCLNG
jgi:myo-inositol-1(or 4)-monophosphatase